MGRRQQSAVWGLVGLTILGVVASAAVGQTLQPRVVPSKPARTVVDAAHAPDRVVIKFREGSGVRVQGGRLAAPPAVDLAGVESRLRSAGSGLGALRRLFPRGEAALDAARVEGQRRSGRTLADLNLYYEAAVAAGTDVGVLCDRLNELPDVELALPALTPAPLPVDIPPTTPDLTTYQGYVLAAPNGIGKLDPLLVPGGDGSGITIVDVEYQWVLDHEDLELPPSTNIDTATVWDPFPADEANHGTAVLGELVAEENGYGTAGIVPGATLKVAPANTIEFFYDIGRAVTLATAVLAPGDVILIEQQTCVCGQACTSGQNGLGPVEWYQPWYDAIATATALGIVVVEAAGNGAVNLDDPGCGGLFDRGVRDSGAIIVGAADPLSRARLGFSCYGSRVDLQGWGSSVATTGYGDLFFAGDLQQRYTAFFSGTSSASPIVTGAAAALQGVRTAAGFPPYTPEQLRLLLHATGTPQAFEPTHIGPRPNLGAAAPLAQACGNGISDPGEACDDGDLVNGDGCDLNCTATACGNGIVTAGETCDDGNLIAGDGCSPTCTSEAPPDPCLTATVIPAAGGMVNGSTSGVGATGGSCGGGAAGEVVYAWTPTRSGTATMDTCGGANYDTLVYVRATNCQFGSQVACNDDACGLRSQVSPTVVAGQTYFIFVDGYGANTGNFTLTVTPPGCPTTPSSCRSASSSVLALKQNGADSTLIWKWLKGTSTLGAEFAAPILDDSHQLCVYGGAAPAPLAEVPLPAANWNAAGRIVKYDDAAGAASGIVKARLKPSGDNKARIVLKGKGAALPAFDLDALAAGTVVELHPTTGTLCWSAAFDAAHLHRNGATLKGKTP